MANGRAKLDQEGGTDTRTHSENSGVDFQVLQAPARTLGQESKALLGKESPWAAGAGVSVAPSHLSTLQCLLLH